MAFNTKYQGSFESTAEETYTVYILEDGYVGSIIPIVLSGVPVKQSWATDEPQPAIKGSSLAVSILNTGSLPITSFYSNNDNQFKVWFYHNTDKLFEGYLVQDDCSELMVDYTHEILLSFNDNLGLLKDVALDNTVPDFGGYPCTAYFDFVSAIPDNFIYLYNTNYIPVVGVPFTISGHIEAAANAAFTPTVVTNIGNGNWKVQTVDLAFVDMQAWPCYIAGSATINLYDRNTLLNIIRVCLSYTNLSLDCHIYANVFETSNDNSRSFLEQTYIDTQSFINGESFDNCYSVLESILGRFKLTLLQANGVWNIVRWQELRYDTSMPYFIYNSAMEYTGAGTFNKFITSGFQELTYPENGLTRSIFRPFQFVKETFNYEQPKYLLRNFDLQNLGALITSYSTGSGVNTQYIFEYEFTDWSDSGYTAQPYYYIRVVQDYLYNEIERYVVIVNAAGDNPRAVVSKPFEVTEGDKIELTFTFKTTKSQAGPGTVQLAVMLYDGTTTNYADEDPTVNWKTGLGWNFTIPSGGNTNENQSVTINPGQIPFDGLIYVYLPQADQTAGAGDETQIKDIRMTYTPYINDSTKIIGHVHTSSQNMDVKNNESVEIQVDDAPRNSIAGTLYKPSFTSLIQDKTLQWYRLSNPSELLRIGEITTFEQERWRQVPRTKLEGTFYGLLNVSMLAILTNNALPGFNFIFGSLEIDYRNNSFSGTQYEIYEDGEEYQTREAIDYEFKYLYS